MDHKQGLINVDGAILSVAQLIQPCKSEKLVTIASSMLCNYRLTKQEINNRIDFLRNTGYLWCGQDDLLLVTPKGFKISMKSLPSKDRDKFRLLFLNKMHYK